MDETWFAIGNVNTDGCLAFKELGIAMCRILTIPHSSAHCERVFSCVRKNRTEQKSCLGDDTLESLLVLKSATGGLNVAKDMSNADLDHIKGASYRSLKMPLELKSNAVGLDCCFIQSQ